MNWSRIDLLRELNKVKKNRPTKGIIEEVYQILNEDLEKENEIINRIFEGNSSIVKYLSELNTGQVFDLAHIKELCVRFRLRFLDAKYFKGEIPYEAIQKIKQLEEELGIQLNNFKIIAPKELFDLEDKDSDPMLFIQLSNNKFYFIHKWGRDMTLGRSLLAFPFRNIETMFFTLLGLATLFSSIIPTPNTTTFIFLLVHSFIALCGIACLLVMMFRENFSNEEWDSQYLS